MQGRSRSWQPPRTSSHLPTTTSCAWETLPSSLPPPALPALAPPLQPQQVRAAAACRAGWPCLLLFASGLLRSGGLRLSPLLLLAGPWLKGTSQDALCASRPCRAAVGRGSRALRPRSGPGALCAGAGGHLCCARCGHRPLRGRGRHAAPAGRHTLGAAAAPPAAPAGGSGGTPGSDRRARAGGFPNSLRSDSRGPPVPFQAAKAVARARGELCSPAAVPRAKAWLLGWPCRAAAAGGAGAGDAGAAAQAARRANATAIVEAGGVELLADLLTSEWELGVFFSRPHWGSVATRW